MRVLRPHQCLPCLLATAATACAGEDAGYRDDTDRAASLAQLTADSDVGLSFANSASHDDPVDLQEDTSWLASTTSSTADGALVRVLLTDTPIDAESVFVTLCGIDVEAKMTNSAQSSSGATWLRISDGCQQVDLLTLPEGLTEALGIGSLPPGDYVSLRLLVAEGSMARAGGLHRLAVAPRGYEEGFLVDCEFSVEAGDATTLTVDFNAAESIRRSGDGGYVLEPALSVVGRDTSAYAPTDSEEPSR